MNTSSLPARDRIVMQQRAELNDAVAKHLDSEHARGGPAATPAWPQSAAPVWLAFGSVFWPVFVALILAPVFWVVVKAVFFGASFGSLFLTIGG